MNTHPEGIKSLDNKINAQNEAKFKAMESKNVLNASESVPNRGKFKISFPKSTAMVGPVLLGIGIYQSSGSIINSHNPILQGGKEVVKWSTAYMMAEIGAGVGGLGGPVAPITVPVGALIGGGIGWMIGANAVGE